MLSIEALSIDHKWAIAESSRSYATYVWAGVDLKERETVKPKESEILASGSVYGDESLERSR
jgi:hypothetical protein